MASISKLLNKVSSVGHIVNSTVNKISAVLAGDDATPSSIRDKYTNGFYGDTTHFKPNVFARLFDEPTYLSFRIKFNLGYNIRNDVNSGAENFYSYDYLPEPFLSVPTNASASASGRQDSMYSAYLYLKDALGETKRANMLLQLIKEIDDIQRNYPYYFTEVTGLGELNKIKADSGIRVADNTTIEIKCYEGLDLKITQILQMYRKIVWDDVYQRWILPDMMRYFNLKIYVSEIRLFHSMSRSLTRPKFGRMYDFTSTYGDMSNATSYDQFGDTKILSNTNKLLNISSAIANRVLGSDSAMTKVLNTSNQIVDTANDIIGGISDSLCRLCNNAINDVMPTLCFDCHMCQFVIEDTLSSINTLKSAKPEMFGTSLKISVGQVIETQSYPLNIGLSIDSTGNSYDIDRNSEISASAYINDEMLMREATNSHYDANTLGSPNTRINKAFMRINDTLDYSIGSEDSYQIFNSSAALSTASMVESVCNAFQRDDVLSTATNNSKHATNVALPENNNVTANHSSIDTKMIDEIDNITKSMATNKEITEQIRNQIVTLYKENSVEDITYAADAIQQIRDMVNTNKQIEDLSQFNEVSDHLKSNVMQSILSEIAAHKNDEGVNKAMGQFAEIILNNTNAERSTATSKTNKADLSGFSLLN